MSAEANATTTTAMANVKNSLSSRGENKEPPSTGSLQDAPKMQTKQQQQPPPPSSAAASSSTMDNTSGLSTSAGESNNHGRMGRKPLSGVGAGDGSGVFASNSKGIQNNTLNNNSNDHHSRNASPRPPNSGGSVGSPKTGLKSMRTNNNNNNNNNNNSNATLTKGGPAGANSFAGVAVAGAGSAKGEGESKKSHHQNSPKVSGSNSNSSHDSHKNGNGNNTNNNNSSNGTSAAAIGTMGLGVIHPSGDNSSSKANDSTTHSSATRGSDHPSPSTFPNRRGGAGGKFGGDRDRAPHSGTSNSGHNGNSHQHPNTKFSSRGGYSGRGGAMMSGSGRGGGHVGGEDDGRGRKFERKPFRETNPLSNAGGSVPSGASSGPTGTITSGEKTADPNLIKVADESSGSRPTRPLASLGLNEVKRTSYATRSPRSPRSPRRGFGERGMGDVRNNGQESEGHGQGKEGTADGAASAEVAASVPVSSSGTAVLASGSTPVEATTLSCAGSGSNVPSEVATGPKKRKPLRKNKKRDDDEVSVVSVSSTKETADTDKKELAKDSNADLTTSADSTSKTSKVDSDSTWVPKSKAERSQQQNQSFNTTTAPPLRAKNNSERTPGSEYPRARPFNNSGQHNTPRPKREDGRFATGYQGSRMTGPQDVRRTLRQNALSSKVAETELQHSAGDSKSEPTADTPDANTSGEAATVASTKENSSSGWGESSAVTSAAVESQGWGESANTKLKWGEEVPWDRASAPAPLKEPDWSTSTRTPNQPLQSHAEQPRFERGGHGAGSAGRGRGGRFTGDVRYESKHVAGEQSSSVKTSQGYRHDASDVRVRPLGDSQGAHPSQQQQQSQQSQNQSRNGPGGKAFLSGQKNNTNNSSHRGDQSFESSSSSSDVRQARNQELPSKAARAKPAKAVMPPLFSSTLECQMTWEDMNLKPSVLATIKKAGLEQPSNIQKLIMKPFGEGKDVIAQSQSQKDRTNTLAITLLQKLSVENKNCQAVVICSEGINPKQVYKDLQAWFEGSGLNCILLQNHHHHHHHNQHQHQSEQSSAQATPTEADTAGAATGEDKAAGVSADKKDPGVFGDKDLARQVAITTLGPLMRVLKEDLLEMKAVETVVISMRVNELVGFDAFKQFWALLPKEAQVMLMTGRIQPVIQTIKSHHFRDDTAVLRADELTLQWSEHFFVDVDDRAIAGVTTTTTTTTESKKAKDGETDQEQKQEQGQDEQEEKKEEDRRWEVLIEIFEKNPEISHTVILTQSQSMTQALTARLEEKKLPVLSVWSMADKTEVCRMFNRPEKCILVSESILMDNLDLNHFSLVINYEMPKKALHYIASFGPFGRSGLRTMMINLLQGEDEKQKGILKEMEQMYDIRIREMKLQ